MIFRPTNTLADLMAQRMQQAPDPARLLVTASAFSGIACTGPRAQHNAARARLAERAFLRAFDNRPVNAPGWAASVARFRDVQRHYLNRLRAAAVIGGAR